LSGPAQRVLTAGRKISQARMTEYELRTLERLLGKMLENMEEALNAEQQTP